jgi:hypothetical protein
LGRGWKLPLLFLYLGMEKYSRISKARWELLKQVADMYEVVGYQYGKNNTYYEVKVWNRDKHENIRYNHVVINENWW